MEYAIIGAVVGAFIGVVAFIASKDKKECEEMVARLSDKQKEFLMDTEIEFVEANAWVQDAIVAKVNDKGNKVELRLLWYNKTIQNAEYETITIADTSIKRDEQDAHNLKVDDKVKMYFAPEKTVGSVKIVWK